MKVPRLVVSLYIFITIMNLKSLYAEDNLEKSFTISAVPCAVQYAEDSILLKSQKYAPLYVEDRERYSTSTGIGWFHQNKYIATLSRLGNSLTTFSFDSKENKLTPLQVLKNKLAYPANLAFSKEGSLVAVANSKNGCVGVYQVDLETHLIHPDPILTIKERRDKMLHGVRFSPNSKFVAYTTIDNPGYIRIFKVVKEENRLLEAIPVQALKNSFIPLKPKGIDFTCDGRFIAICYTGNTSVTPGMKYSSLLAIFPFDMETGKMSDTPISVVDETKGLCMPEDVVFTSNNSHLMVSNQGNDSVVLYEFEKLSGKIGRSYISLQNPSAQLSFPHGIAISSDDKYFAVTCMGDDKFNVYQIQEGD